MTTYDIKITEHPDMPISWRYEAIDRLTFDPDPESEWCLVGVGETQAEAVAELIEKIDLVTP